MIKWKAAGAALGAALGVLAASATPVHAEEIDKKFRIGLALGGYNTQSDVPSNSPNTLVVLDDRNDLLDLIRDPRNDSAAIGTLGIKRAYGGTLTGAYGVSRRFVVEGSVGYRKGELGDVELQFQSPLQVIPDNQEFDMKIFRYKAGTVTQVPLEVTALARFRPKAQISPYIGGGVGFVFIGYKPSAELNQLSANMDASTGGQGILSGARGGRQFFPATSTRDLEGASVDARDTFEWHAAGGLEYAFKKHWSGFVDLRYLFASRALTVRFDGSTEFGRSVPNTIVNGNDPLLNDVFGPIQITQGGLIDAGRFEPKPTAPEGTDCEVSPDDCRFVSTPDGQVDAGYYYVQGGKIKYGGVSLQFGVRYTF